MNDGLAARDAAHRAAALDVGRSFLVQAPAGSGKTELLIQRFLALLAGVDRPERVVAMTFTRKAAGEMRERVVEALRDAERKTPVDSLHGRTTRALADAVLARDRQREWHLDLHPARLQIDTMDAVCAGIARRAPLATAFGAVPRFEEQSRPLLQEAVRDALAGAAADDAAWRTVLAHLDNNAPAAVEFLAEMLDRRDQWLFHLVDRDPDALRATLEATLVAEIEAELAALRDLFPSDLLPEMEALLRYAALNLSDDPAEVERVAHMERLAVSGALPPARLDALPAWRAIASWMLVKEGRFRKTLSRKEGFPELRGPEAAHRARHKQRMTGLLGRCGEVPGLCEALHLVRSLPPASYDDTGWRFVAALTDLLPRLAAQLKVTFAVHGAIDFTEINLAAIAALGAPDTPTDLLLRLDFAIEHLLVDEFQDTSDLQNTLLECLTAGWQPGDGRTLFAVGDPMQSIYRFRKAEVRLFQTAQRTRRVAGVPVTFLDLAYNFRAEGHLVEWLNDVFPRVMSRRDDPWRSTVAYTPAVAARLARHPSEPTLEAFESDAAEAAAVVAHVQAALAADASTIAILVRARSDLVRVLPALHAAGLPFAAVELESLAERQAIIDLMALTHALMQPADRLAWLAVLRAPWCGLMLPDLFAVAAGADRGGWPAALGDADVHALLSADGRARLERCRGPIEAAIAARGRAPLGARVLGLWLALSGPACLDSPQDLSAAERFFGLLTMHEDAGEIRDYAAFALALAELKAAPEDAGEARVSVMTLHKAKGLEFDTVILPGLGRVPPGVDQPLLRFRTRPHGLLLASRRASGGDADNVYRYLGDLDAEESIAEMARLLYVGCTRARTRLHLTAVLDVATAADGMRTWKPPRRGSALSMLGLAASPTAPPALPATPALANARPPRLARLPRDATMPAPRATIPFRGQSDTVERVTRTFDWAHATAGAIGNVAHRLLADVGRDGVERWTPAHIEAQKSRIARELANEGVDDASLADAAVAVATVMRRLVADARGRWLFDAGHSERASELALGGEDEGALVHVTLDRTFVAGGIRWIVDFKTSRHEGSDGDAFLDSEIERYRGQLERYARVLRALDKRPIRLGLYYPLIEGGWREWAAPC